MLPRAVLGALVGLVVLGAVVGPARAQAPAILAADCIAMAEEGLQAMYMVCVEWNGTTPSVYVAQRCDGTGTSIGEKHIRPLP